MVSVSTREYERAHGKKPRGYGHWIFIDTVRKYPARRGAFNMAWEHEQFGKYSECKKAAIKSAEEYGFYAIEVCS